MQSSRDVCQARALQVRGLPCRARSRSRCASSSAPFEEESTETIDEVEFPWKSVEVEALRWMELVSTDPRTFWVRINFGRGGGYKGQIRAGSILETDEYIRLHIQSTYQSSRTIFPKGIIPHKTDKHDLDILATPCARIVIILANLSSWPVGGGGVVLLEEAVQVPQDEPVGARAEDAREDELRCLWG